MAWYEQLGCNIIQTFAVSCSGHACYKGDVVPEQPGLKHDFLSEVVKLGHAKPMQVMGYQDAPERNRPNDWTTASRYANTEKLMPSGV